MHEGQKKSRLSGESHLKNCFPGAVAFVETIDCEEEYAEPADILSFESLRNAFAVIRTAESELVETIAEIEFSADEQPESPELPAYDEKDIDEKTVYFQYCDPPPHPTDEHTATDSVRFERIIEAMLFVGNPGHESIPTEQIVGKLRNVSAEDVDQAVDVLNDQYRERNCPYTIMAEQGGYRIVLRPEFESVRNNFYGKTREIRLSQQAIDTLAVIAYRQPITAEEIQSLRQQPCTSILNQLVRRNLLYISRDKDGDKKSVVRYHTTSRFLEWLQIRSLDEIPLAEELDYR